jgi:hypothetical protein
MKALTAHGDSNAARPASHSDEDGSDADRGYVRHAYPSEGPAEKNSDIGHIEKSQASLGNEGTSRESYKIQADEPNAMTAETGTGN